MALQRSAMIRIKQNRERLREMTAEEEGGQE